MFCVPLFITWCKQQQVLCFLFCFTLICVNNNNCMFNNFKPQLFSLRSTCLHTRLTELLLTPLPALPSCLLYCRVNNLMNVLEEEWFCLLEISTNINMFFTLLLFVCLVNVCPCFLVLPFSPFLYWCCCYIFVYLLIM